MIKIPKGRRLYEQWARNQFAKYRQCVAFIESTDSKGDIGIGTCFHVGDGVFVTARHVVEGRTITQIGFTDHDVNLELANQRMISDGSEPLESEAEAWANRKPGSESLLSITRGPLFHRDPQVDVACFQTDIFHSQFIPLGGHLDDFLGQYELVLYRTLVMGYPPIPFSKEPVLVASLGEVNALIDKYGTHSHPYFVISSMARGGFSGGPALVAYNEENAEAGTAALGLVTESMVNGEQDPELGFMAVLTVEPIYACLEHHGLLPKCQEIESISE